ncbi:MAG TPA: sulfite exporter TauE/SafE family protein [Pseudidiomarina sp.]|nr:sulfite exporter TauE/SafE family protein [Pseudidiomarina sp.]
MDYLLAALIMFIGALLQGITGFGSGLVAVPLLSLLLPLTLITPTLSIVNLLLAGFLYLKLHRYVSVRQWQPLLIAGVLGSLIGTLVLAHVQLDWLQRGMAIFVVIVGVLLWRGVRFNLNPTQAHQSWVGILAGFSNGALTLGGPPIVLFLSNQQLAVLTFRATLTVFFFALATTNVISFSIQERYSMDMLEWILILATSAIIGAWRGHTISLKIPETWFRQLTLAVVIGAGVLVLLSW